MKTKTIDSVQKNNALMIAKGVLISTVLTLALVLVYAVVVFFFDVDPNVIPVANPIIKGISIFIGCVFSIRGANNGWLKGFIIGLFYIVISFMLFSALYQNLDVDMGIFNDVVLGSATGLVSGIMCANIKK